MIRRMKIGVIAIATFLSTELSAQVARPSLSIGAELGIPVGDLNLSQKIGVGGSAKVAFPVGGGTALTLSGGYISFSGDEYQIGGVTVKGAALNFIPIKAGVRHQFVPNGFYIEPQLGYTSVNTSNENSSASGGFTYAAAAGFMLSPAVDLSARYEAVSRDQVTLPHVGFRLAYNFSL